MDGKWILNTLGALALVVLTSVVTWMVSGAQQTVVAGIDSQAEEQIKGVVSEMLLDVDGRTYAQILREHMELLNELTLLVASERQSDEVHREEFRMWQDRYIEDQRIIQGALRELASD